MRVVFGRVWVACWLGLFPSVVAAQLPLEIMVDRYLLRAERLMEANDPKGALEVIGKIVDLQKEHSLTLPNEFHFKHAKVLFPQERSRTLSMLSMRICCRPGEKASSTGRRWTSWTTWNSGDRFRPGSVPINCA